MLWRSFFFFQAEDGIRDIGVTGVQTCALPISFGQVLLVQFPEQFPVPVKAAALTFLGPLLGSLIRPLGGALADRYQGSVVRSEERRVGKECRSRRSPYH